MQRTLEALQGEGIVRVRDRCGIDQLLKTHTKIELTVRAPLPPDRRPFFLAGLGPGGLLQGQNCHGHARRCQAKMHRPRITGNQNSKYLMSAAAPKTSTTITSKTVR